MRKILYLAAFAALAVALVPAATATTTKTVAVSITRNAFVPKSVSISTGDTVKWTNTDTQNHQVACSKCPFTSPTLKPGDTYSHTFGAAGKFSIHDPLHAKIKGAVTVKAGPKGVTLTATPLVTKYLQSTKLSGQISTGRSGQHVLILGRQCGQTVFSTVNTVTTGTGGTFSQTTTPKMNTVYEAKWNTSTSKEVSVRVRPRVKLAKIGTHKFRARVKAAESFVGKTVVFQKKSATGAWIKVKKVTLKHATIVGATTISSSTFKSKIRHGRKVRILLKSKAAAPCYLGNHSSTIKS
jgi:plastocyanin